MVVKMEIAMVVVKMEKATVVDVLEVDALVKAM